VAAALASHGRILPRAQAPSRLWTTRSHNLMPTNGTMIPPRP
jgi:hypothetical protein